MTITSEEPLFSTRLISTDVQEKLPQGVFLRPLQRSDYDKGKPTPHLLISCSHSCLKKTDRRTAVGILEVLSQLSVTGNITREKFEERFDFLKSTKTYFTTVVEDEKSGLIVACATLLAEYKFLHECGKIGHIEDVVVHDSQRDLSKFRPLCLLTPTRLIEQLQYVGRAIGCYKVILNCTAENVAFYEKCNLKQKDVQMTHYFEPFMIKIEEEINQQNYAKYQQRQATLDIGLSPNAEKSFRTMLLEAEQRLQSSSIRQQPTVSAKLTADPEEIQENV
ncbi:hypothetical protein INT44_003401 [Umbelopsis vinacea]|uniref:Glucosamine 6-phosphate N-acetyltransferase n=1 Tax=Umbelopsis vinacea TaxID=44442 RepID=A0A8H7UG38_9FUNG|nr:hypothetical protein INT44_003401 [Umbelopsis vinacea]